MRRGSSARLDFHCCPFRFDTGPDDPINRRIIHSDIRSGFDDEYKREPPVFQRHPWGACSGILAKSGWTLQKFVRSAARSSRCSLRSSLARSRLSPRQPRTMSQDDVVEKILRCRDKWCPAWESERPPRGPPKQLEYFREQGRQIPTWNPEDENQGEAPRGAGVGTPWRRTLVTFECRAAQRLRDVPRGAFSPALPFRISSGT